MIGEDYEIFFFLGLDNNDNHNINMLEDERILI